MRRGTPSATALLVASSVLRKGASHGLPPVAVAIAARSIDGARGSLATLARHRPGRWLLALAERLVLPGLAAHHCARKAWIWGRLQRRAVADGRVVWAGVGFDGLGRALRHHLPGATLVETDHPDTLRQRRTLLGDDGVEMHAIDLPRDAAALVAHCAHAPSTLVCEGVAMYLPARDVLRLLRRLAALPVPPRLLFSALDTLARGGRGFRGRAKVAGRWLARQSEPFRWRASPEQVHWCLAGAGYSITAQWDGGGFGEYLMEAEARSRQVSDPAVAIAAPTSLRIARRDEQSPRATPRPLPDHAGLPDRGQ